MHVFGLTGGVASGKSLVEGFFEEQGTRVIDADHLARLAVKGPSVVLDQLVARFGPEIIGQGGQLERRALGQRVFGDPSAVEALNSIVHPAVAALLARRLAELESQGERLVCYSAPLMFENGLEDRFRPVVLVAAPEALQLERAARRSGWSEQETLARIAAQLPLEIKRARADYVIENGGTLEQTRAQAHDVLARIQERYG